MEQIFELVETLNLTEKRLEKLTGGEVDSIVDRQGQIFFLRRAQAELRLSESIKQAAILNALPAQIALLDLQGIILSVNESWRQFAVANVMQGPQFGIGQNYLEICESAVGDCSGEAKTAAWGIRQVMQGDEKEFVLEYPCHSLTDKRWFRLIVTPVKYDHSAGAVVMHLDITESKLAEEALRASEERFRGMFAGAAAGIAISTPKGQYLQANSAYCRMLGYTEPELRLMNFADVTHPDDLHLNLEMRDELLAGQRESLVMEKRYMRKDGSFMWAQTSVSATHSADGELATLIVIAEDISERKQVVQQLEELSRRTERRERLLSTALSSMSDFAQIYDPAGRILFVNKPLLDLWGLSLEEVVGKNFFDLGYPRELAEKLNRQLQHVFETGQEVTDETSYTSPTGVVGWYEYIFSPAFSTEGKVDFVVGATRDVTQRKAAEVEIRFNEQRYRSLVEATTAIVWDTPASGEFTVDQPGWTAFTGQSFDELRGWGWLNAIHPEDREETARVWSAAVANRSRYDVEHRLQVPDKTYRNMLVRAVPILGEDGAIRQWIGIHTDITERKKLENQFLRAQRMESIGTLAGGIAHDLNNVLAPIMISIDLLSTKFTDPESQELLATLSSSAHRGADMVRQVLSFARGVEGRHMEVQPRHVIKDVEKIAKDTFLKNIHVRTIIGSDLWPIMGDPTQVHQVLLNLCVNARDAMPEGGTLTLSAENVQVDEHYAGLVSEAQSGPYLLMQVEDTGTGIPPGILEKIFDPFFTTKEMGKGTGLGLSTSLAIVKSHGGFVRVYSEMGKGTKFKVYFPAQTEASAETAEKIVADMPRGNGEIILVVDDEASVRHITQQTLQAFGYRVILASDGVEALSIFARQGPEIAAVLTDMMMPVMDGPALIRVLHKLKPTLPIIGASGLAASRPISQSGTLGIINHFLPKPYMANELLKILREILTAK